MLKDTNNLFEKHNITYWMSGGTLLGAIRHRGIIPWDDDADLEIDVKDKQKVVNAFKFDKEYKLISTNFGFKISLIKNSNIDGYDYSFPFIDIFLTKIDTNNKIKFINDETQSDFKNCNFDVKNLFPLKKYDFGLFYLYGAHNPTNYLNSCYGTDWKTVAKTSYDHENEIGYIPKTHEIANYNMALPIGPLK